MADVQLDQAAKDKLYGIITSMEKSGAPEDKIRDTVTNFKQQYAQSKPQQAPSAQPQQLDQKGKDQLYSLITSMEGKGESEDKIKAAVSDFRANYGKPSDSILQRGKEDLEIGWRSSASHLANTAANATSMFPGTRMRDWSKSHQVTQQEMAGRDTVLDQTAIGLGSLPLSVVEYSPAMAGPKRGKALIAAGIGALGAADKGWREAINEGVKSGTQFVFQELGSNFPTRATRAIGSGVGGAAAQLVTGGDRSQVISGGLLGAAAGAISGKPPEHETFKLPKKGEISIASGKRALRELFLPGSVSDEAGKSLQDSRKALGIKARNLVIAHAELDGLMSHFDKMPVNPDNPGGIADQAVEFFDKYMAGKASDIKDPKVQEYVPIIKKGTESDYKALNERNLLQTHRDNYLKLIWDRNGTGDQMPRYLGKRPFQGPAGFQKEKVFTNLSEGLQYSKEHPDLGLQLTTNNPIEMVLLGRREAQHIIAAHDFFKWEEESGLLHYVEPEKPHPPTWVEVPEGTGKALAGLTIAKMKAAKESGKQFVPNGKYYMSPDGVRILNNLMSEGARKNPIMRGLVYGSGALNKFQLSASERHLNVVMLEAAHSQAALSIMYAHLASQRPAERARLMKEAARQVGGMFVLPFDFGKNIFKRTPTGKLAAEYKTPGAFKEMTPLANAVATAGGRGTQDPIYSAGEWRNVKRGYYGVRQIARMAWKEKDNYFSMNPAYRAEFKSKLKRVADVSKIASGVLQIPGALVEGAMWPIFEYSVPMTKLAVFNKMYEFELERLKPELERVGADTLAGQSMIEKAGQKVWDSVDNRLGTFVYDNLGWNNMLKQIMMIMFRSVGWRMGTVREIGGGVLDWRKFAANKMRGQPAEFTHRMAYTAAMPVVTALTGAIMNGLMTQEFPKTIEDFFRPRTGRKDEFGRDERMSIPGYWNDVQHMLPMAGEKYSAKVGRYITGALNPIVDVTKELLVQNKTFEDDEIIDEEGQPVEQLMDVAKYFFTQLFPLSVRNWQKEGNYRGKEYHPWRDFTWGMTGINQAPADEIKRPWERYTGEHLTFPEGGRKPEASAKLSIRKDMYKALRFGEESEFQRLFAIAQKRGLYKEDDEDKLRKAVEEKPTIRNFRHLSNDNKLSAYLYALKDPKVETEEKAALLDIMHTSLANHWDEINALPDTDRTKIRILAKLKVLGLLDENGDLKDE
jgi:hypothetical protein